MTSPMLTVIVLTVLWLIVVVPMIVQRNDEIARERSVSRFGAAMRALGRRSSASRRRAEDGESADWVQPRINGPRAEVFKPGESELTPAVRRPVPGAREALLYQSDRDEMSDARRRMMARRRRSLATLSVGSVVTLVLAVVTGGAAWVLTVLFVAGLGGYLMFLRNQALKDRDRRAARQERAAARRPRDHELAPDHAEVADGMNAVRIDDDDLALHNLDTVDLTGLYGLDDAAPEQLTAFSQRRAG